MIWAFLPENYLHMYEARTSHPPYLLGQSGLTSHILAWKSDVGSVKLRIMPREIALVGNVTTAMPRVTLVQNALQDAADVGHMTTPAATAEIRLQLSTSAQSNNSRPLTNRNTK